MGDLYTINSINYASGSPIHGIQSINFSPGINQMIRLSDGGVYAKQSTIMDARPMASFTTQNIAQALTLIGANGSGTTDAEIAFSFMTPYGTRTAASSKILTIDSAMFVPRSISCSQGSVATLSCDVFMIDGSGGGATCPYSLGSATFTVGTVVTEQFTIGSVTLGGTTYTDIDNISIDFGVAEVLRFSDGQIYPNQIVVNTHQPKITITGANLTSITTALASVGDGTGAFKITFRKKVAFGTNSSSSDGVGIAGKTNYGHAVVSGLNASQGGLATYSMTATLLDDGGIGSFMTITTNETVS